MRGLFTKPYVYYLGSHLGCGCGFGYSAETLEEEYPGYSEELYRQIERTVREKYYSSDEEYETQQQLSKELDEAGRRSIGCLRGYLSASTELGPVELYVRWGYDSIGEPKHRETVTPDYFGGKSFHLTFIHEALFTVLNATLQSSND